MATNHISHICGWTVASLRRESPALSFQILKNLNLATTSMLVDCPKLPGILLASHGIKLISRGTTFLNIQFPIQPSHQMNALQNQARCIELQLFNIDAKEFSA